MSLNSETNKTVFNCTGGTTYDATFKIFDDADVEVVRIDTDDVETVLTLTSSYSISLITNTGFRVTTVATYSNGTLVVRRSQAKKQEADWERNGDFDTDVLEEQLDKQVMMIQELEEEVDRCIKVGSGETSAPEYAALVASVAATATDAATDATTAAVRAESASAIAESLLSGITPNNTTNHVINGDFEIWLAGTNVAPTNWTLSGYLAIVARESTIKKITDYSVALTRNGNNCYIYQDFSLSLGIAYWRGKTVTIGCWVYATEADTAFISISDGIDTHSSVYHTGSGSWEFLSISLTVDTGAPALTINLNVISHDSTAYFDSAMAVVGTSLFLFNSTLSGTFTNSNLSAGILTITHNKGLTAPYPVNITVVKSDGEVVRPTCICASNSVAIDLTPWGTITGTWGYSIL